MHPIWHEIKAIDTSRKALRSFGLVVGGVLLVIAAVIVWRSGWTLGPAGRWVGGIGAALAVLGLILPAVLLPVYRVWMALAVVLGFVMTRVILTLVYFLVLLPIGLVRRMLGNDPMHRHPDPTASTYWLPHEDTPPERLEKYY